MRAPTWLVSGLNPVRALTATFFGASFIADLIVHFTATGADLPGIDHLTMFLRYASLFLMLWRPQPGALLGLVTLVAMLIWSTSGSSIIIVVTAAVAVGATASASFAWYYAAAQALWLVAYSIRRFDDDPTLWGYILFPGLLAWGVGLAARHFLRRAAATDAERTALAARVRSDERAQLARELHDIVAHQLSIISLQVMGHRDSDDIAELRATLDRVQEASDSALAEMRLLVGLLRADKGTSRLHLPDPTEVGDAVRAALAENGYRARVSVAAEADEVDESTQQTLSRLMRECATNILRYGRPEGSSVIEVSQDVGSVRLTSTNEVARSGDGAGLGLRGLAERVELLGGEFAAGRDGDRWVVTARLPVTTSAG